jgi:elongation factor 2
MGANFKKGQTVDYHEKNVSQVGVFMMGKSPEYVADVPCGNTVAIIGIDDYLLKTGTIGSIEYPETCPIRPMKYSVSPVFRVAVRPKNAQDLPKLQKGLVRLSKSDPLLKCDL